MAHAVLGGAAGLVWLVLPAMTISRDVPVAITADAPVAAAPEAEDSSASDLVLPLVVLGAVGALAGYGYVRRTRRARTRTTPTAGARPAPPDPPLADLDERSLALLAEADDRIRAGREELAFVEARSGPAAVAPFTRAVRDAESELSAAFRIRRRYDTGVPSDEPSRRHALAGIVGRCQEAGRRLDEETERLDALRALDRDPVGAQAVAEARFRELTARTAATEATLTGLAALATPAAAAPVTGYVEQAKDRLVLATTHLNRSRQAADSGDPARTAHDLRVAEGATAQAGVLLDAVERLAAELDTARSFLPATLTGAEAELAGVRAGAAQPGLPPGESRARLHHADTALAAVRHTLTSGEAYDPLGLLRRIVEAVAPIAPGRTGVLPAAARLTAHSAVDAADGFIGTHRTAVAAEARTLLAAARDAASTDASLTDLVRADTLAHQARDLAEQDVRVHGNPHEDAVPPTGFGGEAVPGNAMPG